MYDKGFYYIRTDVYRINDKSIIPRITQVLKEDFLVNVFDTSITEYKANTFGTFSAVFRGIIETKNGFFELKEIHTKLSDHYKDLEIHTKYRLLDASFWTFYFQSPLLMSEIPAKGIVVSTVKEESE